MDKEANRVLRVTASGLKKIQMRRYLQDCRYGGLITEWKEFRISTLTSDFEVNGEIDNLQHIYNSLLREERGI